MSKKDNQKISNRFNIVRPSKNAEKEIFSEGDWMTIKTELSMRGWPQIHSETIHRHLQSGWPLKLAINDVAKNIGWCPIHSKQFF